MARQKSKTTVVCQNKNCTYFCMEKGKDIIKKGKNYAKHQRFLCQHCNVVFVNTKGTPLYRRRLSERKIKQLCKELVEKKGIRAVERTTGIHRDTIWSYLSALAEQLVRLQLAAARAFSEEKFRLATATRGWERAVSIEY